MEVNEACPGNNPSDGEEGEQEDEYPPQKGYGKKHQLFGGSLTRQDEANDGEYEAREGESVYDSPGGHRHTHRHKKFRRHRQESSHGRKSRHGADEDEAEEGGDVEDGEILEDGEIEDDEEEEVMRTPSAKKSPGGESNKSSPGSSREHRHSRHRREIHYDEEKDREGIEEGEEEGERSRKDKKKKKRSKKDKHERKDKDKKRRHRGRSYKDPDQPEEQDMISFDKRSRSPLPSYEGANYDSPPDPHDKPSHHHHHHSPSKKRGSPGQYDYHYDSPPGLYDSPSYDEESDEGGPPNLMRNVSNSGYDGEFMDKDGQQVHNRKRKAGHSSRNRRRSEENQGPMPPRKKPLLEIPRHERPHCKFYMEGKCAKGNNCPFNHDFRPPRKPEICKFYLQSTCTKGEFCIYMHGDYPCKYYHTGAECYQGDNCKFSHEPLTDETRPLLEKLLNPDENDKPRPCLLGSPPRHLLEGGGDPTKKIPSLFDIEVFPPGQNTSPRKPAPASPSVRPSGFYKDPGNSKQAPMAGPPGNGPQHPVPPVLNMIGAILRQAPPEVVARVGQQGNAPPQGPPPGMQGPRMQGQGMGPPPRGPFMGPGSSPDPRNSGGPGGPPDMRGPGPNFHRGPPMDQGPMMGPGGPMFQGIDPRGPPMDHFQRSQSMDNRGMMPGMDPRGPPPGMDPRGMPPGMNQRGPNTMDPRGQHTGDSRAPNPMDPRGHQMRMDPRDPRAQGVEQRDSRDPRAADQRGPAMDPRDPRNQNVNSGPADPRTNVNDPRTQKMDPRDPRSQSGDSSDPRNNSESRTQRGLLPDPPGIEKIDPRQNYQEPRNVPFISKDPRAKAQNTRDPRSANVERQDSRPSSAQSPPYEKDSVSESSATNDPKVSPKQEPFSSPAAHREEKMDGIKTEPASDEASLKESPVKMEVKEEPGQDSQDTQELSQDGEKKEEESVTLEIASHLPPTQRNLFLRIRQQQHNQENPSDQGETTETSDAAKESQAEDDDWYSSDEEAGDTPKLMDVLKNLNKQPVPPPATASSTASTFNIMQMIQSIKNQSPADKPAPSAPPQSPSHSTENPKQSPRRRTSVDTVKSSAPQKEIVRDYTSSPLTPDLSVAYPVIEAVLTSMVYRIKECTVTDKKPYTSLPNHVDQKDVSYQGDPRVQKYIARMGKVKPPMSSPVNGEANTAKPASVDPRRARHLSIEEKASAAKPLDPRVRRDPRTQSDQANPPLTLSSLEKAVTEQLVKALDPRVNDPRLQRGQSVPSPAMHNLPVKPVKDPRQDPRLGSGGPAAGPRSDPRSDPRSMSRQLSHDGRLNDPRSAPFPGNDPRMGFDPRMGSGPGPGPDVRPPFDNRMPFNPRMQFGPGPVGPRMGPGGPMSRMPFGPRMGGPDNRMGFDPRMGPDQRMPNEPMLGDPRSINDPRSGGPSDLRDPRSMGPVDPRSVGPNDPRGVASDLKGPSASDPRGVGHSDPRSGPSDPRSGPSDPRSGGLNDPRSSGPGLLGDSRMGSATVNDPRAAKSDPRSAAKNDPRLGGDDPRLQGLQRANSDPRSAIADRASAIPAALLEPPKATSSDNASESESGMSDSQSGDQTSKKFDYRNDPRFKRKPATDSSEKGILVKKFTGQRKSSMEYSSPLGMEDSKSENSGYNSYNRPNQIQNKVPRSKVTSNCSPTRNTGSPSHLSAQSNPPTGQPALPDIAMATGGLDPSIVSNLMTPPQVPLPNEPPLKDLFKSIDPTASPFC